MDTRPLGRTGLQVTKLCLGTMTRSFRKTEEEGHAQIAYALDRGINFLDTAEMYAVSPSAETRPRAPMWILLRTMASIPHRWRSLSSPAGRS